jgi:hypothetical protein
MTLIPYSSLPDGKGQTQQVWEAEELIFYAQFFVPGTSYAVFHFYLAEVSAS